MPAVFIEGYKFRFYSSDVNEPPHVHVFKIEYNRGYNQTKLNKILKLMEMNSA